MIIASYSGDPEALYDLIIVGITAFSFCAIKTQTSV